MFVHEPFVQLFMNTTPGEPIQNPAPYTSHIALPPYAREQLASAMNSLVATSTDLATQCKMAHWNTRGPTFYARHELFDEATAQVRKWTDMLAERAGMLGAYATGTVRFAASESELPDYDRKATTGLDHLRVLIQRFALYCRALRGALAFVEPLKDAVTEDVILQILREAETLMWTLDSHILPSDAVSEPVAQAHSPLPLDEQVLPAIQSMQL